MMGGDRKKAVHAILGPKKGEEDKKAPGQVEDPLHEVTKELIGCIKSDDHQGALAALKTIFEELDSEPHRKVRTQTRIDP